MRKIQKNSLFDVILFTMILHSILLFWEIYNILKCMFRNGNTLKYNHEKNSIWYVFQFYFFFLLVHTEAKLSNFVLTWIFMNSYYFQRNLRAYLALGAQWKFLWITWYENVDFVQTQCAFLVFVCISLYCTAILFE